MARHISSVYHAIQAIKTSIKTMESDYRAFMAPAPSKIPVMSAAEMKAVRDQFPLKTITAMRAFFESAEDRDELTKYFLNNRSSFPATNFPRLVVNFVMAPWIQATHYVKERYVVKKNPVISQLNLWRGYIGN
jgi:hypothetical protein